jgi:hypothetical protein
VINVRSPLGMVNECFFGDDLVSYCDAIPLGGLVVVSPVSVPPLALAPACSLREAKEPIKLSIPAALPRFTMLLFIDDPKFNDILVLGCALDPLPVRLVASVEWEFECELECIELSDALEVLDIVYSVGGGMSGVGAGAGAGAGTGARAGDTAGASAWALKESPEPEELWDWPELVDSVDSVDALVFLCGLEGVAVVEFVVELEVGCGDLIASLYVGGCTANGGGGGSFTDDCEGVLTPRTGLIEDKLLVDLCIGDKVLLLIDGTTLVEDLDLLIVYVVADVTGDKSNERIVGVSRNSGCIAFNCGDAIGEKGLACGDNISMGTLEFGLNMFDSKIVSFRGFIILSMDCLPMRLFAVWSVACCGVKVLAEADSVSAW